MPVAMRDRGYLQVSALPPPDSTHAGVVPDQVSSPIVKLTSIAGAPLAPDASVSRIETFSVNVPSAASLMPSERSPSAGGEPALAFHRKRLPSLARQPASPGAMAACATTAWLTPNVTIVVTSGGENAARAASRRSLFKVTRC